jgi:murein DD-endopeptidase MepM/ murein hydrolase activator NlpD
VWLEQARGLTMAPMRQSLLFAVILLVFALAGGDRLADPARAASQALGAGSGAGGALEFPEDSLSDAEHARIAAAVQRNVQALRAGGRIQPERAERVSLSFPLRASTALADPGFHTITNLVDHNAARPGLLTDYYCYGRTYDTPTYNHSGTDIAAWPFAWRKMDDNEVEVIAAAPGVIVYKEDGNADRNCTLSNASWNAVYVRHSDGSTAWYGHLKRNSLTSKPVGAALAVGEYLGVVGSSGSSTGPHLHFELRAANNTVIDPFFDGSPSHNCNPTTTASWWAAQPAFYDSTINKLTTGYGMPIFNACPTPETHNVWDDFALEPSGTTVYFTIYYRDLLFGQVTHYRLYAPDGALYDRWSRTASAAGAQYWWSVDYRFAGSAMPGTWRLNVTYQGASHDTHFNLGDPIAISVQAPLGGTRWPAGAAREVRWTDNIGGNVRIELWREGVHAGIVDRSTASDGLTGFTMPRLSCGSYTLRVINEANPALFGESGAFDVTGCVYLPAVVH